jgi:hypothetical protein
VKEEKTMATKTYGDILYPNSPFIIDKIYPNLAEAQGNAASDGILLGRYIMVAYCKTAFGATERSAL